MIRNILIFLLIATIPIKASALTFESGGGSKPVTEGDPISGGTANRVVVTDSNGNIDTPSYLRSVSEGLGIGITPTFALHVSTSTQGVVSHFASTGGAAEVQIQAAVGNSTQRIGFAQGGADNAYIQFNPASGGGAISGLEIVVGVAEKVQIDINGAVFLPPSSQTIAAGNTVSADACGGIKQITAAGAVTTDTTNTFTAPAVSNSGCVMHVCNVGSNTITLDNNANFVSVGAADVTLTASDCVLVGSNGTDWYQLAPVAVN